MTPKPESRVSRALRVRIRGTDANGQPFAQTARTVNISRHGARLRGMEFLKGSGQEVELSRWWRKARYRVVWVGDPGREEAGDAGLQCVEPGKNIWGVDFPASSEQAAAPEAAKPASEPMPAKVASKPAPHSASAMRTSPLARRAVAAAQGVSGGVSHSKEFALRMKCPYCPEERWLSMRAEGETIDRMLNATQEFECSTHGVHQVLPLEGHERTGAASPSPIPAAPASFSHGYRRSRRIHLQVPVLVYGRRNGTGTFREETSTMVVNAGGGLVGLRSRVEPGQSVLLVNKQSQEERECRVAFIGSVADGKVQVGLAFQNASPAFWQLDYHKTKA